MKISFSTISCPDYTLPEMARAVDEYGYDGIELFALEGARLTAGILSARVDEIKRELASVPISCINSWGVLSSLDPDERRAQEEKVTSALRSAADLGCPLVKTFGGEFPAGRSEREVVGYVAESISRLAGRAAGLGITLVLETHDGFSRGAHVGQVLDLVESEHFGALWDVHHPYRKGETPETTDRHIGARVRHAHVKDAVAMDNGWKYLMLGDGELPVLEMMRRLAARGFDGFVSVDWEKMAHPELDDPEVALPQYAGMLREYIARTAS